MVRASSVPEIRSPTKPYQSRRRIIRCDRHHHQSGRRIFTVFSEKGFPYLFEGRVVFLFTVRPSQEIDHPCSVLNCSRSRHIHSGFSSSKHCKYISWPEGVICTQSKVCICISRRQVRSSRIPLARRCLEVCTVQYCATVCPGNVVKTREA